MQNFDSQFEHLAPPRDEQFCSLGFVCQLFRISPGQLRVLMEDTGVKFSRVLDGVGYLSIEDAEKVGAKCADVKKAIHDVREAAANN